MDYIVIYHPVMSRSEGAERRIAGTSEPVGAWRIHTTGEWKQVKRDRVLTRMAIRRRRSGGAGISQECGMAVSAATLDRSRAAAIALSLAGREEGSELEAPLQRHHATHQEIVS
jgi:hypothetical protein